MSELDSKQLVPLDLSPIPFKQDEGQRRSMHALVQRWHQSLESWHGPLRVPEREEFLATSTEDFVLTSNGSTFIYGVDGYLKVTAEVVTAMINVTMSSVILEVAENSAWMHDIHTWILPDGYKFASGRYGRLYRRKGEDRICRWEILQTNPIETQEFFDTRYRYGRR